MQGTRDKTVLLFSKDLYFKKLNNQRSQSSKFWKNSYLVRILHVLKFVKGHFHYEALSIRIDDRKKSNVVFINFFFIES
jgi:hypothetical protein